MTRYYEGVIKRMPNMTMEAYLKAIGVADFLERSDEKLYKDLLPIKIRELANRGYFMNRSELREELTRIYRVDGLDHAVTVFYKWLEDGKLHMEKNSKGIDLTEIQVIHNVRYSCDYYYRVVRMFHRKLMIELKKLNKLDLKISENETLGQRLKAIKENIEREEPLKRTEPLKVIDESIIGVKDIIDVDNIPEERVHPEGSCAIWYNGYQMKVVGRDWNNEPALNVDRWNRLHVSNKVVKVFEADCVAGKESYSHNGSNTKRGQISLAKNRERVLKWKHYMIDMWNARYNGHVDYDARVPSENRVIREYYAQRGSR